MGNFYSDIIELDPRFQSVKPIGDLNLLEPTMRGLVRQVIRDAATLGFELMAFETYRSQERQEELFDQHATQLKKAGAVVLTRREVVSADGRMLTITSQGKTAAGQPTSNMTVYDKQ